MQNPSGDDPPALCMPNLVGLTTPTGWVVKSQHIVADDSSGGNFSVRFVVERMGKQAFMKILDIVKETSTAAARGESAADVMMRLSTYFVHERDLNKRCQEMDRIATAIDAGEWRLPGSVLPFFYLVFDLADGDMRGHFSAAKAEELLPRKFRLLHHCAIAVQQLHNGEVFHQDIKPSNVVTFPSGSRITDLGRSIDKNRAGPFDTIYFSGDRTYAPPEILYGVPHTSDDEKRRSVDIYMLGNLATFCFTQVPASVLLREALEPSLRPGAYGGKYSDLIPSLVEAHGRVMDRLAQAVPFGGNSADIFVGAVAAMTHPDPAVRGYKSRDKDYRSRLRAAPFVTIFNRLAYDSESGLLRSR